MRVPNPRSINPAISSSFCESPAPGRAIAFFPSSSSRSVSTAVSVCTCRRWMNEVRSVSPVLVLAPAVASSSSSLRRAFCCDALPPPS